MLTRVALLLLASAVDAFSTSLMFGARARNIHMSAGDRDVDSACYLATLDSEASATLGMDNPTEAWVCPEAGHMDSGDLYACAHVMHDGELVWACLGDPPLGSHPTDAAQDAVPANEAKPAGCVLVVGSINVDLYKRLDGGKATFDSTPLSLEPIKGMTLPAASFLSMEAVCEECESAGVVAEEGDEEALVLSMTGPFQQKTGGKGANAAAAAGQTFGCQFIGNMGAQSAVENAALLADLKVYGDVDVTRCAILPDAPTGTAYILLYDDNDNAIVLIGGANQQWPSADELRSGPAGKGLRDAITESVCVMLQREVPEYVNVVTAELARAAGKPVFMDVGGTDAPLDEALMPYITVIAPNESELSFISGMPVTKDNRLDGDAVRAAIASLKGRFAAAGNPDVEVLVTLGRLGSCHFDRAWAVDQTAGHEVLVGCFPLSTLDGKPKDTCGAGDCFRGSYVGSRYGEGKSVREAMMWASAAGSLAVEVEGAMPSMPTREMIQQRLKQKMAPAEDGALFDKVVATLEEKKAAVK